MHKIYYNFFYKLLDLPQRKILKKDAVPSLMKQDEPEKQARDERVASRKRKLEVQEILNEDVENSDNDQIPEFHDQLQNDLMEDNKKLLEENKKLKNDLTNNYKKIKSLQTQLNLYKNKSDMINKKVKKELQMIKEIFTENQLHILLQRKKRVNWKEN